ncbi:hypothetical protein [Clostridium gasigenes]|uniref:hypothetical protein n=1 Tax=Clostridium gasigenes TaxID=94869 RepID=UPI001C0D5A4F|nr:hypothetical protein [Clostridium gasigenes]MBU3108366.1 hypothetical protein [Clostridium gasigenes]
MKKFVKFLIGSIIIVTVAFGIFKFTSKYNLDVIYQNIDWSINVKGYEGAKSFDYDEDGNLYIGFKDTIRIINNNGKDEVIIKENNFDIFDILCSDNRLFIATDNRVVEYNLKNNKSIDLIRDIPNTGMNKETKLLVKDNVLYLSIGTNTNSGIVNEKGGAYDKPGIELSLTGVNYGENKTGIFSPFAVNTEKGEKVKDNKLGNGSIMAYDFESKKTSIYAHGLRNINGFDIDSDGKIKGIVGGMEDIGPRPIKDDKDYIYEFKKSAWYGWPDYSGGDPITSPRFTDGKKVDFLIENHPTKTPSAPIYQHIDVKSLKGFAIDTTGEFFLKDTMVFADNKEGRLYALTNDGILNEIIDLGNKSNIEKIKFYNDSFYVLDSKLGCLYKLQPKNQDGVFNLPIEIWLFIISLLIVLLVCGIFKFNKKSKIGKN